MINACATLHETSNFVVGENSNLFFDQEETHLLQNGRTARNKELWRFEMDPIEYPEKDLLALMLQMKNSPTGLFRVVRKLPDRLQHHQA